MNRVIKTEPTLPEHTKCGEIYINDASTDAFLYCSFCTDETDEDTKFLRTLQEFIDHIKWHRSDDFLCQKDDPGIAFESVELEATSELGEPPDGDPIDLEIEVNSRPREEKADTYTPDISGDILIKLIDLYKKCPCLWHKESAENDKDIIESTYKMLTNYYNDCTQKNNSVEFVKHFIQKVRHSFLEEFMGDQDITGTRSPPWYFPHLMFLLMCEEKKLDESIYTDYDCTICSLDFCSQEELWKHLYRIHLVWDTEDMESLDFNDNDDARTSDAEGVQNKSERQVLEKFLDAYKNQPRLWNKENIDYNNRKLRDESYDILLRVLQEQYPTATRNDVMNRLKCFRTRFTKLRRRIEENNKAGYAYEPRIWYYSKLLFLVGETVNEEKPKFNRPLKQKAENIEASCSVCNKMFTDETEWLDHIQSGHERNAFRSADGFFYCFICDGRFKNKNGFIRHLRHTHSKKSKMCNDCGLEFRFLSALANHRAKVHKDFLPFKCDRCGKGFAHFGRMKTHVVTHWDVDDRPHVCPHCKAKFSNRANLKVHIRRHTRDFHMRCEICNHTAATSTELRFHMYTHTKVYPFICDICGRGFRSAAPLANHQKECSSKTTFTCRFCKKRFKSIGKLQEHDKNHRTEPKHECKICGKKFVHKTSVQKHVRRKHQESLEEAALFDDLMDDEEIQDMKEHVIEREEPLYEEESIDFEDYDKEPDDV